MVRSASRHVCQTLERAHNPLHHEKEETDDTQNLHNHATFEITGVDEKEFLEGRISFRVIESTTVPIGSTPSEVHTLRVTNGYLPPLESANDADLKCQKAVAGAVRRLLS